MKRAHGRGSVTQLADGRFWARGARQDSGKRPSLGYFDTREEAERAAGIGSAVLVTAKADGACRTFESVAKDVLDTRELGGTKGIDKERIRFDVHVLGLVKKQAGVSLKDVHAAHFAKMPIDKIDTTDIAQWLRTMASKKARDRRGVRLLAKRTVKRVFSLLSAVFEEAGPQGLGLIDRNPCLGLRVKGKDSKTEEPWTFLTLAEQHAIRDSQMPEADKLATLFAMWTGIRGGEFSNLELRDLHVDGPEPHVVIRFGSAGDSTKSNKIREVPLFPAGVLSVQPEALGLPHPDRIAPRYRQASGQREVSSSHERNAHHGFR